MSRIKEDLVSKKDEMISLLTELVSVRSVEGSRRRDIRSAENRRKLSV